MLHRNSLTQGVQGEVPGPFVDLEMILCGSRLKFKNGTSLALQKTELRQIYFTLNGNNMKYLWYISHVWNSVFMVLAFILI